MATPRYVPDLPDLISANEYERHPGGRLMRLRISVTDNGLTILGDAFRPDELEALLASLGGGDIEQMLCG